MLLLGFICKEAAKMHEDKKYGWSMFTINIFRLR